MPRRERTLMPAVLWLALAPGAWAAPAPTPGLPSVVETRLRPDLRVRLLAPRIWLYSAANAEGIEANGLLVSLEAGVVLVDAAWNDAQAEALLDWSARAGPGAVRRVVVTHSHADRTGGIAALLGRKLPVLGLDLTAARQRAAGHGAPEGVVSAAQPVYADPLGFEIYYPGPGHSVDNIVVWFPNLRLLHGGCLVKAYDANDLGNVADADLERWPASIEGLQRRYPAAEWVVPGHGPTGGSAALRRTLELLAAAKKR